jgi:cell division protein FtsL
MARSRYEYSTSPRKLQPDYSPRKKEKKNNLKIVKDSPRQEIKISKEQIKRRRNVALIVVAIFVVLLTVSYRNSQINEKFSQVQKLKKELSSLQKENEQLKVNIENGLNLNNIEKLAKEKLGMQKLTNRQTLYVSLPKKDYVEAASEEVKKEDNKNWFQNMVDSLFNK